MTVWDAWVEFHEKFPGFSVRFGTNEMRIHSAPVDAAWVVDGWHEGCFTAFEKVLAGKERPAMHMRTKADFERFLVWLDTAIERTEGER